MQFTATQISELVSGRIEGDGNILVSKVEKIEEATSEGLTFLANPKYEPFLYSTLAAIVIINEDFVLEKPVKAVLIRVKDAYSALSLLLERYKQLQEERVGIEEPVFIHATAEIGKDVYIGAFTYIGAGSKIEDGCKIYPQTYLGDQVRVGAGSTLFPGVKVYRDCEIGERVIIHSGSVIGSDGFGFAPQQNGSYQKVSQIGNVIIEDDVEIGANTTIDRATMGHTMIRKGVKIDNLIQLAHNVEVGENTVIAAQTGVSGSAKIGSNVVLGGQVGVVGHIQIADGSQVQAQSGVNRSITEPNKKWGGSPAFAYQSQLRAQVVAQRLPELERRIYELERLIKEART